MKEFAIAAKAAAEEDDPDIKIPVKFKVGDQECLAYRPEAGQLAIMYSRMDESLANDGEKIAAMIDFFMGLLDKESRRVLSRRLMDREDDFELEDVNDILSWLMEEWAGRPTTPSNGSTRSRVTGGRKSTATARGGVLTPSGSDSIAS